ncbi:MAG: hypothetical protein A2284_05515 [Deltaproteobacteria bacterium RIFOXYA12_FULL_61_11]|nr:MAG: hypothetical protein A2284_05515 [Deltaproteobacteria bacterium RIFOXYA12_FULL_61_11]
MAKERKTSEDVGAPEAPGWICTYGDMMSLLLCFFIMLSAMSSLDAQKLKYTLGSLKGSLGMLKAGDRCSVMKKDIVMTFDFVRAVDVTIEKVVKKVRSKKKKVEYVEKLKMHTDERGIVFRVEDAVLFDPGLSNLKTSGYLELDKIISIVEDLPNAIRIEGHSDATPHAKGEEDFNWKLSTLRAVNVLKYMIFQGRINPERVSAMGFGDQRPIAPNDTAAWRKLNRRVEVIILFKDFVEAKEERAELERKLLEQEEEEEAEEAPESGK